MRLKIIRIVILLCFCVLALDLVWVQVIKGNFYYHLSVNNRIRVIPLEGLRGNILDRNGKLLAGSRLSFDVAVIPQDIAGKDALFVFLSEVLDKSKLHLLRNFQRRRRTPFAPVVVAEDVEQSTAMIIEENRYRFPGLYVQESYRRRYPDKGVGAHLLGYVGKIDSSKIKKLKDYGYTRQSLIGYSGIEEFYDKFLRGKEGGQQIEVDSRGQQVRLLGLRKPEKGTDIYLTIDHRMQQAAAEALEDKSGAIVVMDLDSGEILGMVSAPSFDPNVFSDYKEDKARRALFLDSQAPLLNRAVQGQYPPGSVFKVVMTAAGLDSGEVDAQTIYHCPGFYKLGQRKFRCAHVHGNQRIVEALGNSCNVYYYNIGLLLGSDRMHGYARMFGLGEVTGIDLPAEEKGRVPSSAGRRKREDRSWYKGDTLNFSIGQGDVLTTPLQVVRLMAAVGRGGRLPQPFLLKAVGDQPIVTLSTSRKVRAADHIFDTVQQGLRTAVTGAQGTARMLDMEGFEIYGKTGTAQTAPGKNTHAWFAGYNLQGSRRIAFCVFLEYGGSSYYAVRVTKNFLRQLKKKDIL
ncbi:MAG: penicillin-binding protein 2 [Candidatus Omnitrophota bacterium]